MRVGVLTTSYPRSDDDPAGHFVAGFARWLAARGARVEVLCADERRPLFYRGGAPGSLLRRPLRGSLEAAAFSGRLALAARRRRARWDAVVSHWVLPCGLVGTHVVGGRPHLAIAHGSDVALLARLPGGARLLRSVAASADLVYVAQSLAVDGAPGRVVPMGVDASTSGDRRRGRAPLGIADDRTLALVLARLSTEKGVDLAIEALPHEMTLVVAGAGPERERLEQLAKRRDVRFVGEVRGEAKRDLLAAADVLVVPSRRDGAPTVVTEAALAGVPVIATRIGGLPELVGDAGLLCAPTVSSLRESMTSIRDDRRLRARLADAGRERARSRTWHAIGPALAGRLADRLGCGPGEIRVVRL